METKLTNLYVVYSVLVPSKREFAHLVLLMVGQYVCLVEGVTWRNGIILICCPVRHTL